MIWSLLTVGRSWGTQNLITTLGWVGLIFDSMIVLLIYLNMETRVIKEQEMYLAKLKELGFDKKPEKKMKLPPRKKNPIVVVQKEQPAIVKNEKPIV